MQCSSRFDLHCIWLSWQLAPCQLRRPSFEAFPAHSLPLPIFHLGPATWTTSDHLRNFQPTWSDHNFGSCWLTWATQGRSRTQQGEWPKECPPDRSRTSTHCRPASNALLVYSLFVFNHLSKGSINYCSDDLAKADHHLKMTYVKDKRETWPGKRLPRIPSTRQGWSLPCRRGCTYWPCRCPSPPQSDPQVAPRSLLLFPATIKFSSPLCLVTLPLQENQPWRPQKPQELLVFFQICQSHETK